MEDTVYVFFSKYSLTGWATVFSFIFFFIQYGALNQFGSVLFPRLELQLPQQIATVSELFQGGRWLRCSMVALFPRQPLSENDLRQYTQTLSLVRIFSSSCSGIPYLLNIEIFDYMAIPKFNFGNGLKTNYTNA